MAYAYETVANDLLSRIRDGEWRKGDQLPPLDQLQKVYPQSRMTLYKALQHLADQGHVAMARGRGTFVKTAHARQRIAILTGAVFLEDQYSPFVASAYRHAHAYFSRCGVDVQLYAEDPVSPAGLPVGLMHEFEHKRLTGLLSIEARFPARHMATEEWRRHALPYVNIGAASGGHRVYVDHDSFIAEAVRIASDRGRRRAALVEKEEHRVEHDELFYNNCHSQGIEVIAPPPRLPAATLPYEEYGFRLTQAIAALPLRPDVLIVPDDAIAKGVTQALLAQQIAVPDEILVIAMTNSGAGFFYPTPIIRVEVDVEELVAIAAGKLVECINAGGEPLPPDTTLVTPRLRPADA